MDAPPKKRTFKYYKEKELNEQFVYLYKDWSGKIHKVKLVKEGREFHIESIKPNAPIQKIVARTTKLMRTDEKIKIILI